MSSSPGKRVVVTHMSRDGNRGDLAILTATVERIREAAPDAAITVVSAELAAGGPWDGSDVRWTRALGVEVLGTPTPSLQAFAGGRLAWCLRLFRAELAIWLIRLWGRRALTVLAVRDRPVFAALLDADCVIAKGGSYLHAHDAHRDLLYLWRMLYLFRAAHAARQPVVPTGISIGPFSSRFAGRLAGRVLKRCPRVSAREGLSAEAAVALGLKAARVSIVPDTALSLSSPAAIPRSSRRQPKLGLAVRALPSPGVGQVSLARKLYEPAILDAARMFLERHKEGEIRLIPQTTEDAGFEAKLEKQLSSDRVTRVSLDGSIDGLLRAYAELDVLLASRLHATLLGLIAMTPAVHIACEYRKSLGTMSLLGLERQTVRAEAVGGPQLIEEIDRALRSPTSSEIDLDDCRRRIGAAFAITLGTDAAPRLHHSTGQPAGCGGGRGGA